MPIFGITGGVATGKSTFGRLLLSQLPAGFFDSDQCARNLLETNGEVLQRVVEEFGESIRTPDGLDRKKLGSIVFGSAEKRRVLEKILHPEIRSQWLSMAGVARSTNEWLIVDLPLLFETGSEHFLDRVIVVGSRKPTQLRRLIHDRKVDSILAEKMIAAQMDLDMKISKCNHLIWNDGSLAALEEQTVLLAGLLKRHHG